MLTQINQYIRTHSLLTAKAKVLVGVSGGVDSVVLIHALFALGYECIVAHMNFSLRGEASDGDENFVHGLCRDLNIPFYAKKVDTLAYAREKGISMEMAARDLRYAFFDALCQKNEVDRIAVGHHKNDLAETFLINLSRGTGLRGLSGIQPVNGKIIRPLLCLTASEVRLYAKQHHLDYRTDASNSDVDIIRNRIRHRVIPEFERINPAFIQTLEDTARRMQQIQEMVNDQVARFSESNVLNVDNAVYISLNALQQHPQKQFMLFELLHPYGCNSAQIGEISKALNGISGKEWFTAQFRVTLSSTALEIRETNTAIKETFTIERHQVAVNHPFPLAFNTLKNPGLRHLKFSNWQVYFDADKLVFPLVIRPWEQGDRFVPFGMRGHKKLSDFLVDMKLSIPQKEEVYVLLSGNEIIWVVGLRTDNRYKISEQTEHIFEIRKLE